MKRFLSVLLAVVMVFSTVSYAAPSLAGNQDSGYEAPVLEEPAIEEENAEATLAAVDATEYGELVVRFTYDNLTAGTDYLANFKVTTSSLNNLSVVGGELGSGSHMYTTTNTVPFAWDGENTAVNNHAAVIAREESNGNKYLELQGTGSTARFGIRDYNGMGFANDGHYILTADVLSASNTKPFTKATFQDGTSNDSRTNGDAKFTHSVYIDDEITTGEWSTIVVSYDDTHDEETISAGTYDHHYNNRVNFIFLYDELASGEVVGIDNLTLWWVPAEVSFDITHDVEGILDDGTYTIGGGIKTIEEIEAVIDPEDKFADAGYYLAGLRDENGYYTDDVAFIESGKSYTAVWDRLNLLLGYSFDGTEDLTNVGTVSGSTGTVKDGAYVTTSTADYASYRIDINNVNIDVADIGDIVYRIKNTGTGTFTTQYFVYVGTTEGTKTQSYKTTVSADYTVISTTDLWGLPSTWMSSIATLKSFRVQGNALTGAVVHYDYIHVIGKDKDAGDNVLIDTDAPDCELNSFKVVFDSTTTAQSILDSFDTTGYAGVYEVDGLVAPDGTVLTGSDLIADYVDDEDVLTINWKKSEYIGEYGELVLEVNFEKLPVGVPGTAFTYDMQTNGAAYGNFISNYGSRVNPKFAAKNTEIYLRNESGDSDIEIKEDAEHGKYVEYTITSSGASKHVWDLATYSGVFTDKDGYFILTADYIQPKDGHLLQIHWNRSHNAEDMVKVTEKETYPAANTWGEYRSIYDADTIGTSSHATPIADITEINHVLLYQNSQAVGETYAFDNIRLWWVPKTVNITVPAGDNTSVSDQVFTIVPTETTVGDLVGMIYGGTKGVAGLSLTEGGELLPKNKLLALTYDTTLYPVWENLNIHESSLEFNSSSDISKLSFRTGKNNSLGSGFASIVDNSYMRVTFTGTETTQVVQDTGFNYTLPTAIAAGGFNKIEMRVRFTGMPDSTTTLNQAGSGTTTYNPASVGWPEMYYNSAAIHDADNTISLVDKDGEWFVISYSAEEMGLASTALTQLRYDFFNYMPSGTTLDIDYIRFIGDPLYELTVDMGDNTSATPVTMSYSASTTVAEVLAKIIDHGDKKLVGLSRTSGGEVLDTNAYVGAGDADAVIYAVWEDYEYLDNYNVEFTSEAEDGGKIRIYQNNAQSSYTWNEDGYLTLKAVPVDGYTATWDHQIYVDTVNPATAIPAGVVDYIAVRMRYRNVPSAKATYTISGRSDTAFDPANAPAYVHIDKYGSTSWGSALQSNNRKETNIVDGQWFVRLLDANTYFNEGLSFVRFDTSYPMPAGMEVDFDYIRFIGDETKLPATTSQYGEKVWSLDFDSATTGVQTLSYKKIIELGATANPAFDAAFDYENIKMTSGGSPTTEIVANEDGSGNYLKITATKDGTSSFLYVSGSKPFSSQDGYYIVTYDIINNSSVSVPHTFRMNYSEKVEDGADNIQIIENGDWDKAVVYYDNEIGTGTNSSGYVISAITDITNVKFHNVSSVKTGETICIDNLTLWYVPKTVGVVIDNSAVGLENTLIEEYPTKGMTNDELAALLPTVENGKFTGLSTTADGELIYENRSPVSQILYSNWSIDTVLTVDMGNNTKLSDMTIQIPAGSSITVSEIEEKFIDHGDKIFAGLSLVEGGEKLSSTATISATEDGAITIYALWTDYYTNDFYSVEFDHKGEGVADVSESHVNPGKNSAYHSAALDASGNAAAGDATDSLVWNEEEGYLTMKYDASAYAKAQAAENGYTAIVWDSYMEIDTLYDAEGDASYLPAGDADYVVIRMRYRGMSAANTAYWRADTAEAYTLKPANVYAPFYYYTTSANASFGSPNVVKYVSLLEGSAYRDSWFTVFIPASELTIDANNVYRFRLDPNDGMPDGSAIDIDFIRFIHTTDETKNFAAPVSREDRTSARVVDPEEDAKKFTDGISRNGIRVLGEITTSTAEPSEEFGWMFTSSERWNKSGGSERSWYELKMDLYDANSSFIKVGYHKVEGNQVVNFFEDEDDFVKAFTAVLYNIPIKNYKSPFIVRPFAKLGNNYAYGEPFEINFLDVLEAAASAEEATTEVVDYYNECNSAYAAYLSANADYNSSEVVAALNDVMSSASSIKSSLVIPTNDTAPTVSGDIVTMKAWMDGSLVTLNVSTKDTYPAIIDTSTGILSDAYNEKPCVYYLSDGVYYIRSLGRSTDAGGDYNGLEKSDATAMEANVDASALFLSEITDVVSPFQRLPIDDELTNGKDSFFLGDFATGEFDFTFQRANSATRTISTGKTGIIASDSVVVAKYNFPNGTTEWVSYSLDQLLKMGIDSNSRDIADGIDFTNLTYVVSNNTTSVASGTVNQREYEDLAVLAGVVDVPTTVNYTTTNFLAAKYNKVIVKTTSAASYVTVKFTRDDGVSDSIKYYAYGTTADGYRLFDVDLYGMGKYHSTITSLTVTANSGSISYAYLVEDPEYYSSADLANMEATMIFQDTNYENGFYVRDMDQKMKYDEYKNYTFANNGNTPVWMIDPWYAYDYSDSANKASYELYNIASSTATKLADSQGTKVVEFTGETKTSTYADGSSHTGDILSLTLNSRAIYDGMTHSEMVEAGMVYWPHLLIEQSKEIYPVDVERNSTGADKIFMEMDVQMPNYEVEKDTYWESVGSKILSFLLYSYIRPIESPNDRIWFGAQIYSESSTDYPTWNRDTGASAYIYSMPQEVVFQGVANSFWQQIEDEITETSLSGNGTDSTSMGWVHISIDITPYIQTAIDWANREDAFGIGRPLTRDEFYFDGVNIGFETHGNIDGTFEIANFNFVAYNEK